MAGSHGANLQHQPMARQRPCEWCHSLRWQRFCPWHTTHSIMGTLCSKKHQLIMWHDIPSDIQEEILRRLPVKSLVRFRCVSKQWKSLIDSSKAIKDHSSCQHRRLLARHKLEISDSGLECECFSIVKNNDVFANVKSSLTLPLFLSSFMNIRMHNSVNGFLCFEVYGFIPDPYFAVFWNPTVGKCVSFKFPNGLWSYDSIGFGVCPDTFYPKLLSIKISDFNRRWEVSIFTLSSCSWKTVYKWYKAVCKCDFTKDHVCIKRSIYWLAECFNSCGGYDTNVIISFDLKSEKFGKVRLPHRLLLKRELRVMKVNGSLGVIEYIDDVGYDVWMMEFVTKSFTKMFTIKTPDDQLLHYNKVFEFRKNGDNKSKLEA